MARRFGSRLLVGKPPLRVLRRRSARVPEDARAARNSGAPPDRPSGYRNNGPSSYRGSKGHRRVSLCEQRKGQCEAQ